MTAVILTSGPQLAFWLLCAACAGGLVATMVCAMCAASGTEDMHMEYAHRMAELDRRHDETRALLVDALREHESASAALAYEQGRAAELDRLYAALRAANESAAISTPAEAYEALQPVQQCASWLDIMDEFGRPESLQCAQPEGHRGWTDHPHTAERDGWERHELHRWTADEASESHKRYSARLEHTDYVLNAEHEDTVNAVGEIFGGKVAQLSRTPIASPLFNLTVHRHMPLHGMEGMGIVSPCSMACRLLTSAEADEMAELATTMPAEPWDTLAEVTLG